MAATVQLLQASVATLTRAVNDLKANQKNDKTEGPASTNVPKTGQHLIRKSVLHARIQVPPYATIVLYVQVMTILPLVVRRHQSAIIQETGDGHIHRGT